jgi:hypothetical protein
MGSSKWPPPTLLTDLPRSQPSARIAVPFFSVILEIE